MADKKEPEVVEDTQPPADAEGTDVAVAAEAEADAENVNAEAAVEAAAELAAQENETTEDNVADDGKWYAWSVIRAGDKSVKIGEEVTKNKLGLDEEDWEQLVRTSSVRHQPYPKNTPADKTPAQHLMDEALAAQSDLSENK